MEKYIFTIIMSIYNVEEYIEESINSIINQSFPFNKVQLILVNDGSTDNSKDICLKYSNYYSNIEYYEKENGGLSSARNYGLKYAKGKYISFTDPDDTISELALEKVNEFFQNNREINLVGLVVKYFGGKKGIHPRYAKFEKETVIVDLDESPQNYILSSAATFYRKHLFNNLRFDTSLNIAEDLYFNCQIFLDNNTFGVISSDEAIYNYRIRSNHSSLSNIYKYNSDTFTSAINFLYHNFKRILKDKKINMPPFLQYIMIGEIIKKNKALNKLKGDELKKFHKLCHEILKDVDEETIRKFYSRDHLVKIALLILKYNWDINNIEYKIIDNRLYANSVKVGIIQRSTFIVSKLNIINNQLKIEGVYNDIIPNNKSIYFRFKDSDLNTYDIKIEETDNVVYLNKTLGIVFNKACRVECDLPIKNTVYKPYIKIAGMDIQLEFNTFNRFSTYDNYVGNNEPFSLFNHNKEFVVTNNFIEIKKKKLFAKISYNAKKAKYINDNYNFNEVDCYRRYNKNKKKYILINDRPMMANDNGQAIFEYINKHHKKVAKHTYYAISKESEDYSKLKKIGKVVDMGSYKHKKLFINSKLIISSHAAFYNPFNEIETKLNRDILKYKFIFLQHGITMNDVHKPLNRAKSGIDLLVTSSEREKNELLSNKYMFRPRNIILTGLPRFDKLKNKKEKLIVVSPTWRTFLSGPVNSDGLNDPIDNFEKSEYYKKWKSLLNNSNILKKCRNENYKILFLIHPNFTNYFKYFEQFNNDIVTVKKVDDIIYSELFNKLSLLITDYSSILFDVAYLKKPIIFYQFDKEDYFTKHYKPGYFSYEKDGFGAVVSTEKEVEDKVLNYFKNGFVLENKYINHIEKFFKYIDKNNCKRVYNEIINLLNEKK